MDDAHLTPPASSRLRLLQLVPHRPCPCSTRGLAASADAQLACGATKTGALKRLCPLGASQQKSKSTDSQCTRSKAQRPRQLRGGAWTCATWGSPAGPTTESDHHRPSQTPPVFPAISLSPSTHQKRSVGAHRRVRAGLRQQSRRQASRNLGVCVSLTCQGAPHHGGQRRRAAAQSPPWALATPAAHLNSIPARGTRPCLPLTLVQSRHVCVLSPCRVPAGEVRGGKARARAPSLSLPCMSDRESVHAPLSSGDRTKGTGMALPAAPCITCGPPQSTASKSSCRIILSHTVERGRHILSQCTTL